MNLEARLKNATQDPILSELKGSEGLFAVTPSELIYVDAEGVQRAPLAAIRRVASAKGGRILVTGKEETFIEASASGFDLEEVKLFFQSVKEYVAKARKGELAPARGPKPAAPTPSETVEKTLEVMPTAEGPLVVPDEEFEGNEPAAPEENPAPSRANPLRLPLKLLALLTWVYAGVALYLQPGLDPLWMAGLVLGGLGLGLSEWRIADL